MYMRQVVRTEQVASLVCSLKPWPSASFTCSGFGLGAGWGRLLGSKSYLRESSWLLSAVETCCFESVFRAVWVSGSWRALQDRASFNWKVLLKYEKGTYGHCNNVFNTGLISHFSMNQGDQVVLMVFGQIQKTIRPKSDRLFSLSI